MKNPSVRRRVLRPLLWGLALATASQASLAVQATPSSMSLDVSGVQTVVLSSIKGTLTVSSSPANVVSLTKVSSTTYEIRGLNTGSVVVTFKDRSSSARVKVAVSGPPASILTGRLLASNCFQCHGTNGSGGFEKLVGESQKEIYEKLREFGTGKEEASGIMAAHAMGFTDAQMQQIASYLSSLR